MRDDASPTRGLVAVGDSITAGDGEPMLGLPVRTWAHWVARALDLPYSDYASNGAFAPDVLRDQVPRVHSGHAVAAVYAGINDVRTLDWDPGSFERTYGVILDELRTRADRVVACLLPHDLGRPTSAPKPAMANMIISALAIARGVGVADLSGFGGWTDVLPDTVHPTAAGHVTIADVVARALGTEVLPSALADPRSDLLARAVWTRRYAVLYARDLRRRAVERAVLAVTGEL